MTAFSIRNAGLADVPQLSTLGRKVFVDTYGETAAPEDMRRHVENYFGEPSIRSEIELASVQYLLASAGDSCAGLVKIRNSDAPQAVPASPAVEVQQLYVSTDFQRRGVGRLLMDRAMSIATDRGAAGVWLSVWTEADWATSFYLNYGFVTLDEIPFMLGKTEYIDYLMWLPIDVSE